MLGVLLKPTKKVAPQNQVHKNQLSYLNKKHVSHNQNSVLKWSESQNHASGIKKADSRSYLWLGLSLTNLHLPSLECGSADLFPKEVDQRPYLEDGSLPNPCPLP